MKLTGKDKDFLERLKKLLDEKELAIDLKEDGYKRLILRQNYGDKVEKLSICPGRESGGASIDYSMRFTARRI